ncbi:LOW QUALITY PROTEIN: ret finger protein-like 4A-like protein 1 [Ochotona princeps]|uniref:LOW QUALITY PROTEIN: ret finger protein-like 4A-like protein 1 n=1 Tax=Ochotona princeps TaxID=9978 RepID=UPI0027150E71|nr:LOW QUALITY PROTEIN: ret finger protein-like 4A-like protein 1 [Ochotona princeps]
MDNEKGGETATEKDADQEKKDGFEVENIQDEPGTLCPPKQQELGKDLEAETQAGRRSPPWSSAYEQQQAAAPVITTCRTRCTSSEREPGGDGILCFSCPKVSRPKDIKPIRQMGVLVETFKQLEPLLEEVLQMNPNVRKFQVDVTLDVDTANEYLFIAEDLRSVGCVSSPQTREESAQRFDIHMCVLGSPRFTSGYHYWEVDVGSCQEWDVGICRDSVNRKGPVRLSSECGFWIVSRRDCEGFTTSTEPPTMQPRIQRVSIFLNMNLRSVSFYNTTEGVHIVTFTKIPTDSPLRPFFAPRRTPDGQQGFLSLPPVAAGGLSAHPNPNLSSSGRINLCPQQPA